MAQGLVHWPSRAQGTSAGPGNQSVSLSLGSASGAGLHTLAQRTLL